MKVYCTGHTPHKVTCKLPLIMPYGLCYKPFVHAYRLNLHHLNKSIFQKVFLTCRLNYSIRYNVLKCNLMEYITQRPAVLLVTHVERFHEFDCL